MRDEIYWERLEVRPGTYDWSYCDGYVDALARAGRRLLLGVDWSNRLYRSPETALKRHPRNGIFMPETDRERDAFAQYVLAVLNRYAHPGGERYRPGLFEAIEVWNEANGSWTGDMPVRAGPDGVPAALVALTRAVHQAVGGVALPGVLGENDRAAVELATTHVRQDITVHEMARVEVGRRRTEPAEIPGIGLIVCADQASSEGTPQDGPIAERDGVTTIVEDLDHRRRTIADLNVATKLVAGAGREPMADLLPVTNDAAGNVPALAERVVAPGEQNTQSRVLHQEIHVGCCHDLVDEAKQRPRQLRTAPVQLGEQAFQHLQLLCRERLVVGCHRSIPLASLLAQEES